MYVCVKLSMFVCVCVCVLVGALLPGPPGWVDVSGS